MKPKRNSKRLIESEPNYFSAQVSEAQRFFLNLNPTRKRELVVVSGGCEQCRPDYEISRLGFPFVTIEFVARGLGKLILEGKEYKLTPGTVFVYGPQTSHAIHSDPRNPLVKYFCAFADNTGQELMEECHLAPGRVVLVTHPEHIHRVFEDLVQHGRGDHPNRARMCIVALQYLIMKIGDEALPYGETAGPAFATYQQCRRFIEENFATVRSLHEVAKACHVNSSYLCRLFQRFGRERPNRYLQHLRLNHAADLLQNSARPVKDIAEALGFSDPFNFSRAFHRAFGLPPGRVRRIAHTTQEASTTV